MSTASARRVLVPVGDSVTMRNTVAYVVREAVTDAADPDADDGAGAGTATGEGARARERSPVDSASDPVVHFVYPASWQAGRPSEDARERADDLLERVRAWVAEDLDVPEDEDISVSVTTTVIGDDEYLFSPRDYADVLLEYAREHDLDHVVLDPEYKPGSRAPLLSPLATELDLAEDITYEEAPVERAVRGRRLLGRSVDLGTFLTVFGLSFLFYQVLGGFAGTFDFVTGAVSAGIVAVVLSGITFDREVRFGRAARTVGRWVVYVPYLFWEVAKANIGVAYVVLHPSMPIDPSMERFRPAVPLGLPVTSLANSITLTPGTVTVDIRQRDFYVHALTQSSRDGLYGGGLERAIRFVFFGRDAARIPSPEERGQREDGDATATGRPGGDDG